MREALKMVKHEFGPEAVILSAKNIENEIELGIDVEDLHHYINQLPENCKIVFNMYVIEGYKHIEIAEILNVNIGTSKTQLYRARKALKEMISSHQKRYYETK